MNFTKVLLFTGLFLSFNSFSMLRGPQALKSLNKLKLNNLGYLNQKNNLNNIIGPKPLILIRDFSTIKNHKSNRDKNFITYKEIDERFRYSIEPEAALKLLAFFEEIKNKPDGLEALRNLKNIIDLEEGANLSPKNMLEILRYIKHDCPENKNLRKIRTFIFELSKYQTEEAQRQLEEEKENKKTNKLKEEKRAENRERWYGVWIGFSLLIILRSISN